jgi:hypothetical protein
MILALASAGAGFSAQKQAEDAADAQSKSQQNLLERREEDQRQAMVENSKRLQGNKMRQLAQVRASQAASGFNTSSGTPLAVFGEIGTRMDDEINEQTNRALDAIGEIQNQSKNLAFNDTLRASAGGIQRMTLGVNAAASYGSTYKSDYKRSGTDPFGIFKKDIPNAIPVKRF